jgi:hypothetical protein
MPGLEKTRLKKKKTSPAGFFWVFLGFFGFFGFFWFFLGFLNIFAQKREFLGFFRFQESIIYLSRILCLCVCDSQLRNALLFF